MISSKICKKCLSELPATNEYFHSDGKYLHSCCITCRNSERPVVVDNGSEKVCTVCKKLLPANLNNFHYTKRSKDGLRSQCKLCRSIDKKKYRDANKEKITNQSAEYRSRPDYKEKREKYHAQEHVKQNLKKYSKERYHKNPKHKIIHNMRTSFNSYIKKNTGTFDYLGIDRDGFLKHIESQFLEGMTWENYGFVDGDRMAGWHVDHIIPLASFDFSEPETAYKAWHYTNLRPLWARDNISKGCKII